MLIRVGFEIDVESAPQVPMLLALSTHGELTNRVIGHDTVRVEPFTPSQVYYDRFKNRITRIVAQGGTTRLWSDSVIEVSGAPDEVDPTAWQIDVQNLPHEVLSYLVPSRYCDSDNLTAAAWENFSGYPQGWARVQAITDFVHNHIAFGYQFGRTNKTASDVYRERTGVCRDFAHLAIALCRAMNIPARYVSGYLGDIGVPYQGAGDFCAWFEVYLGGRWLTLDARYNTPRIGRVPMVRGCDAADVAMITSFGEHKLTYFRVWSDEVQGAPSDADVLAMLQTRPQGAPLVYPSSGRVA